MRETSQGSSSNRSIVLIHGLWMTPLSWGPVETRLRELGYEVSAPAWPGHDGDIETVRAAAPSALAALGFAEVTAHFEEIVRLMSEPPILVGHSFGGLVVQVLLDSGLGAAGVAIDSAAPKGVSRLPLAQVRSTFPVLSRPGNRHKAVGLTFAQFRYAFANTMTETEARQVYDRYAVPDTGRPVFQAAFADFTRGAPTAVDYGNSSRSPLLLIAGAEDHIVPAAVTRSNFRKYRHSGAVTDFREFPGRSHLILVEQGWREVIDYAHEWLTRVL